jgi:hypothetical protein
LGAAVDDFIAEHSRQWAAKTIGQNRAYLNILVEYFGPDRLLGTITRQDANEVKKVLQALPANRNTKPKLKAMCQAATVMMHRGRATWLRTWPAQVARRHGRRRAMVTLARRIAVILHRMWRDGTVFRIEPSVTSHAV